MVNKERGEVAFEAGGETYTLCLTLNALAEIEAALGISKIADFGVRLSNMTGGDLRAVLGALLRGGGHEIADEEIGRLPAKFADLLEVVADAVFANGILKEPAPAGQESAAEEPEKN